MLVLRRVSTLLNLFCEAQSIIVTDTDLRLLYNEDWYMYLLCKYAQLPCRASPSSRDLPRLLSLLLAAMKASFPSYGFSSFHPLVFILPYDHFHYDLSFSTLVVLYT